MASENEHEEEFVGFQNTNAEEANDINNNDLKLVETNLLSLIQGIASKIDGISDRMNDVENFLTHEDEDVQAEPGAEGSGSSSLIQELLTQTNTEQNPADESKEADGRTDEHNQLLADFLKQAEAVEMVTDDVDPRVANIIDQLSARR